MAEYSRIAKGSVVQSATGKAIQINLPFQPTLIKLTNYTAYAAATAHLIPFASWDITMGQGYAVCGYCDASSAALEPAVITSQGFSTFSGGISLQLGPQLQIDSTTLASNTITTASAHGLVTGDVVILEGMYQSSTTGSPQICGMPFVITVTSTTAFTINWDMNQSNFTALSGSPTGAYVRQVLYPNLYLPGVNFISAISTGTTTTITTTTDHNYVVGQEIAFRIPASYGTTGLNSLPNISIPGSPIYGYVTAVSSNTEFVCSINSSSFTAFNSNQTVASVPGLQFPQVVAVGDVNSGGTPYNGGALYPSPVFPTYTGGISSINGPAISGAFVNNTYQGFIIGGGNAIYQGGSADTSSHLSGTASDVLYWEAYLTDYANP